MKPKFEDEQKPDPTSEKKDGGFYFPAWGIHVIAKTEKEAKKLVKLFYNIDVDKDLPPQGS